MTRRLRVLIIEDSEEDMLLLLRELRRGGYEPVYEHIQTPEAMRAALETQQWDLVISDYVMPRFSGLAALAILRESGFDMPFIIVSGNIGEDIAVGAMKAGAHDYIIKGNLARLVPAVERELREAGVRLERRKAEEALLNSLEEIADLYNNAPCGYHSLDSEGSIVRINDTELQWLGYTREEIVGKVKLSDILTAGSADTFKRNFPSFKSRGLASDVEYDMVRKDGTILPILLNATAVRDGKGNYVMSRSTVYDVTELKKAKERIFRLNRLYSVLSKVNEAIVRIHDPEKLYEQVCRVAVEDGLFKMAWIGLIEPGTQEVKPAVSYGDIGGYLNGIRIFASDISEGRGPTGKAIYEGAYSICSDIEHDARMFPWRDKALQNGFRSSSAFPLRIGPVVIGAFTLYSGERQFFTDEEIGLLSSLADNISFALESIANEKKRLEAEKELTSSRERLRSLSAYLQSVREEERTNIAREIHDELGQVLTALKIDVSWIGEKYQDNGKLHDKTATMLSLIDSTIRSVKRICTELRPSVLDHLGVTSAIEWQAGEVERRTGLHCNLSFPPEEITLEGDLATVIFRVFQESLTNVVRHAEATRVDVTLKVHKDTVTLTVSDNGKGISENQMSKPKSFGLLGIRERARSFGGEVTIVGAQGKGTTLTLNVPLAQSRKKQ